MFWSDFCRLLVCYLVLFENIIRAKQHFPRNFSEVYHTLTRLKIKCIICSVCSTKSHSLFSCYTSIKYVKLLLTSRHKPPCWQKLSLDVYELTKYFMAAWSVLGSGRCADGSRWRQLGPLLPANRLYVPSPLIGKQLTYVELWKQNCARQIKYV